MIETVKSFFYRAFGLNIKSEISLPEVSENEKLESEVDIQIQICDLTKEWSDLKGNSSQFVVGKNSVMFKVSGTAIFSIKNGREIIVSPLDNFEADKIRLYVLGTCIGVLLMQRKVVPLHGSAISINGKAYAFIGDSGAGKSTLASAFLNQGYQLLSDDVIAVTLSSDNIPKVSPSYPQQKLWKESLEEFGMDTKEYRPLFERETKFAIPVTSKFFNKELPLGGVFELVTTDMDKIILQQIKGLERLHILFKNTFRGSLIPRLGLLDWHFTISTHFAKHAQFYRLHRPITGFTAPDLVTRVLSTINKGEEKNDKNKKPFIKP